MEPFNTRVVQRFVDVKDIAHLPQLTTALKELIEADTKTAFTQDYDDGRHILFGTSEDHLNEASRQLENIFGSPLDFSPIYVSYRETVTVVGDPTKPALSKSPNKHNRLYMTAEPLDEDICTAIESGAIDPKAEFKDTARILADSYCWDERASRKIWSYGPNHTGPNLITDMTKAVTYLHEIRDSTISGFQWATFEGPLCGEPMRGVKFNIVDVTMLSDAIHRGGGQIIPTARRACFASLMMARPTLMEPVFCVEVSVSEEFVGATRDVLESRGAEILDEEEGRRGKRQRLESESETATEVRDFVIKAQLRVAASFGLTAELEERTQGRATASVTFDHWARMHGDPLDTASQLYTDIVRPIRLRKGLPDEPAKLSDYYDKL